MTPANTPVPGASPAKDEKPKGKLVKVRVTKPSGLFWMKGRPKSGETIEVTEEQAQALVAARHAVDPSGKLKPPKGASKPRPKDDDDDEDDDEAPDDDDE